MCMYIPATVHLAFGILGSMHDKNIIMMSFYLAICIILLCKLNCFSLFFTCMKKEQTLKNVLATYIIYDDDD